MLEGTQVIEVTAVCPYEGVLLLWLGMVHNPS